MIYDVMHMTLIEGLVVKRDDNLFIEFCHATKYDIIIYIFWC